VPSASTTSIAVFRGCIAVMSDRIRPLHIGIVAGESSGDALGAGLILLGLVLQAGLTLVTVKLLVIAALLFFTSPSATHALAQAARARGLEPELAPPGEGAPSKN